METTRPRLQLRWDYSAKAELRNIDRETAIGILHCIDRFLLIRTGDIKKLNTATLRYRLRCGDYRVLFIPDGADAIAITSVRHRRDAYR